MHQLTVYSLSETSLTEGGVLLVSVYVVSWSHETAQML